MRSPVCLLVAYKHTVTLFLQYNTGEENRPFTVNYNPGTLCKGAFMSLLPCVSVNSQNKKTYRFHFHLQHRANSCKKCLFLSHMYLQSSNPNKCQRIEEDCTSPFFILFLLLFVFYQFSQETSVLLFKILAAYLKVGLVNLKK